MNKKKVKELIENAIYQLDPFTMDNSNYVDLCKNATKILEQAKEELNKSDWVSVEDGLPEYGENVLAISKSGYMNVSYRRKIPRDKISLEVMDDNGFILNFNLRCSSITHWKPIEKLEDL